MDSPPLPLPDLTWAALLARWVDFARASVGLPATEEGDRWRQSVAPIVSLQAVTFALSEIGELTRVEAALGLARADVLIEGARSDLARIWAGEPTHPELAALVADADAALRGARAAFDQANRAL
ncbi:MAG: hypothetical protein IBJ10_00335 [Phycisphaerales bacterium]|nr:hypothetical protein [Phycisphaerales bacterium]